MFIVDTNFFIQAHRYLYPLDVVPSFWIKVKELAENDKIISIDKVRAEIYQNEDALKEWCEANLPDDFFKPTETVLDSYGAIANWAYSKSGQYNAPAIAEFLDADEADAWIVAYSLSNRIPVVTYEKPAPNSKRKIKIPEVCDAFGLPYLNTIDMLRELEESF